MGKKGWFVVHNDGDVLSYSVVWHIQVCHEDLNDEVLALVDEHKCEEIVNTLFGMAENPHAQGIVEIANWYDTNLDMDSALLTLYGVEYSNDLWKAPICILKSIIHMKFRKKQWSDVVELRRILRGRVPQHYRHSTIAWQRDAYADTLCLDVLSLGHKHSVHGDLSVQSYCRHPLNLEKSIA